MKKFVTLWLSLVLLLSLIAPARADVLWEPDNRFYETHRDQCTLEERSYYANGEDGFVTLWNAPNGSRVEGQFENSTVLRVYWRYKDWGCVSIRVGEEWVEGWVPMADLVLIYDYISFAEGYADQITPYNGEFADYGGDADLANFFAYPGAGEVQRIYEYAQWTDLWNNLTGSADGESYIQSIFVDEDGRTWGYVGYMYGHLNAWFCLDEPDGVDFPEREMDAPALIPARTPVLPTVSYVPYVLVGAVVLVTAGLLLVFFRKKKK